MIPVIISLIFFGLAAVCNAVMDKIQFHFYSSVFRTTHYNQKFWNPEISWRYAKKIPFTKYKVDAWHLHKSAMIIFQALAACSLLFMVQYKTEDLATWKIWAAAGGIFICYGIVWNTVFNVFFNKLLSLK